MRKFILTLIALAPMAMWAQDNTWEKPEEEPEQEVATKAKDYKYQKYLKGAVTEENGRVVFTKNINAPGKSAAEIYNIVRQYMEKMTKEKNQLSDSKLVVEDTEKHIVGGMYDEWLVFRANAISLDRTRFIYSLKAECKDGSADITITNIRYVYEENRKAQRYTAEEWISDKVAVNKKNTKLLPLSGKFRRKTCDRKDFLFNKFESLLQ